MRVETTWIPIFERFAENAKWPKEEWATNLATLLQGKALDVYSRLSSTDAIVYDTLKEALLKRYQLTEEGFRVKFRLSKQESGETANQFIVRLDNYLTRWMDLGKVDITFEGLKDLILREQFLAVSGKNLVMFLKERKIKSVEEMTQLADQYIEAHGIGDTLSKVSQGGTCKFEGKFENTKVSLPCAVGSENFNQFKLRDRVCYSGGQTGHFIKECPTKNNRRSVPIIKAAAVETVEIVSTELETFGDRKPEKNNQENNDVTKSVATCIAFIPGMNNPSISRCGSPQETDRFESSRSIPFVSILNSGGDTGGKSKMPVMYGFVDSMKVSVLRDSGCNTTILKENLVDEKQLKNDTQCCILADGTVRRFPVACIQVDTPYYVGEVNALCMANPVYDLVIGNIQGARPADKPDPEWVTQKESKVVSQQVNAVETRAQSRDKSKTNPLQTPKFIKEFTKSDIITNQMTDESLVKSGEKAETGEKTHYKNGGITWYVKEGNLLYRKFQAKVNDSTVVKQLVVPKEQRSAVLKLGHDSVLSGHMGMRRTKVKILSEFWWPGLDKDIRNYCRSCDVCQKTVAKGKVSSIPLGKMPIIDTPFS